MSEAQRITVAALADGAVDRLLEPNVLEAPALIAVEIGDESDEDLTRAVCRVATTDRVVVGMWRDSLRPPGGRLDGLLEALDTTYSAAPDVDRRCIADDVDTAVARLAGIAERRPATMRVFAAAVRIAATLPLPAALEVESLAYSTLLAGAEHRAWLAGRLERGTIQPPPPVRRAVRVERHADELRLVLDRPERRNAFGAQLRNELVAGLQIAVADDGIREVTISGAGPAFCSGGDLGEFGDTVDHATSHLVRTRGGPARLVHELGERVRFRVHGACIGAGTELPSIGSRVTADPTSFFRLPEVEMGLIPGAGGTAGLPSRIGRWRTFGLCASGVAIDATTAKRWGLVDEIAGMSPEPAEER
ncbi:MAG: enoyl-CoA hydratase/isomerase family protein [Microbacterium sp.]